MSGAAFALTVNVAVALLIAATFLILSRAVETSPGVRWFGISYAIGAGTPASELLVRLSPDPDLFVASSFITFSLAFHVMAYGLAVYYGRSLPGWLLPTSFLASLAVRAAIWGGPRNTLPYEFYYQLPFAVALGLCAFTVFRVPRLRPLDLLLGLMFSLVGLHFLLKPLAAVTFGSGATAKAYVGSQYALISQSVTAILLVGTALALLLVVIRDMLEVARRRADMDGLSGLLNRRAFDREAELALAERGGEAGGAVAIVFDIDHFKSINDRFGHAAGDRTIQIFAGLLRDRMPADAVLGRTGGEEFAVLLAGWTPEAGERLANDIRRGFEATMLSAEPASTVSGGVAGWHEGEELRRLIIRADAALYISKNNGRNCVTLIA